MELLDNAVLSQKPVDELRTGKPLFAAYHRKARRNQQFFGQFFEQPVMPLIGAYHRIDYIPRLNFPPRPARNFVFADD